MKRTCYSAYPVCLICPIYLGVIFFLFLVHTNSFSHTCIDLTKGNMLTAMLHSMAPAHTIINDGEDIVIEKEGSYHILGHSEGAIVVNADNVIIDLNGFTLSGSTSALITVSAENIIIRNGVIEGGCFNTGILFAAGARNVLLQNLYITNCQTGISFEGMVNIPVECCRVLNCYISVCDTAVQMEQACNNIFKNVVACCCQYAGFSLNYSKYNKFQQCKTIGIGTDDKSENVSGFVSLTGLDNLFYECFVENICKKDDANFCTKAAGFRFGYAQEQEGLADVPERESKIINCVVDSIVTTSLGNAYGIYLESKLLAADAITSVTTGLFCESINDID